MASVSVENPDCTTFTDNFICKSRLCVICTKLVVNEPFNSKLNVSSSEAFLKGVDVLCDVLQLERKFVSEDVWRLAGTDNFINFICCAQCSSLLTNLVSLRELIIAKKAALEQDVKEIENIILQTSERADDLEFASNTCVLFRNEVLKGHQLRAATLSKSHQTEDKSVPVPILIPESFTVKAEPRAKRSKRFTPRPSPSRRNKKRATLDKKGALACFVKLERCDLNGNAESSEPAAPVLELDQEGILRDTRDFKDDDVDFQPSHLLHSPEQSSDEEFIPETKRIKKSPKPIGKGKRRGRPRKIRSEAEMQPKRGRGRPRTKPIDPDKPAKKSIHNQNKYGTSGRDIKQDKYLHDGHFFKPVLVLDLSKGEFMFIHVKFKEENRTLFCQHPNCIYCIDFGTCFSEQDAYKSIRFHIQNEHRNYYALEYLDAEENKYYCCYYCDAQFPTRQPLSQHVQKEHGEAPVEALCEICCCTLPGADLVAHIFTHKTEEEKAKALEGRAVRERNLKYRILPSDFPCDQCHRVCKSYTELRIHKISHVPIEMRKQYQCDLCPTRLSALSSLLKHIESVHNKEALPTPFICDYCGRTYNKNEKIKYEIHLRQHTGERPFKCSTCGKGFTSQELMTRHEYVHKNLQIQCEYCSSVYKNPTYLRKHHRTHHPDLIVKKVDNITSNKCPVPREHEEGFIGPKMVHPCEPCGKVFVYKSQFISHMKHRHKLELPTKEDYPNQNTIEDGVYDKTVKVEVERITRRSSGSGVSFATPFYMPGYGF